MENKAPQLKVIPGGLADGVDAAAKSMAEDAAIEGGSTAGSAADLAPEQQITLSIAEFHDQLLRAEANGRSMAMSEVYRTKPTEWFCKADQEVIIDLIGRLNTPEAPKEQTADFDWIVWCNKRLEALKGQLYRMGQIEYKGSHRWGTSIPDVATLPEAYHVCEAQGELHDALKLMDYNSAMTDSLIRLHAAAVTINSVLVQRINDLIFKQAEAAKCPELKVGHQLVLAHPTGENEKYIICGKERKEAAKAPATPATKTVVSQ